MSDQPFDIETIRRTTMSKRFLAADRAKLDLAEIGTWDTYLLRESRLLVPIDVQALAVMDGDDEKMVRLPMLIAGPNGQGVSRLWRRCSEAGTHIHVKLLVQAVAQDQVVRHHHAHWLHRVVRA